MKFHPVVHKMSSEGSKKQLLTGEKMDGSQWPVIELSQKLTLSNLGSGELTFMSLKYFVTINDIPT